MQNEKDNHQQPPYIMHNNDHIHNYSNNILNNKTDCNYANKTYHFNGTITNNSGIQNVVSKSVIFNLNKNTLDYKNNKNLILNQQQNKTDINGNNTSNNNHQMYEKQLNGKNQFKNGFSNKNFIISNCDNKYSNKQLSNYQNLNGNVTNHVGSVTNQLSNGNATNLTSNILTGRIGSATDFNARNVLNGIIPACDSSVNEKIKKASEALVNGRSNDFVRNCSHTKPKSTHDYTIATNKISISRQLHVANGQHTYQNGNCMHNSTANGTAASNNIPNIIINGSSEFSEKSLLLANEHGLFEKPLDNSSQGKNCLCIYIVTALSSFCDVVINHITKIPFHALNHK